jgi:hypothetical protein
MNFVDSIHISLLKELIKCDERMQHSKELQNDSEAENDQENTDIKSKDEVASLSDSKTEHDENFSNHGEDKNNVINIPLNALPLNSFTWPEILRLVHFSFSFLSLSLSLSLIFLISRILYIGVLTRFLIFSIFNHISTILKISR